MSFIIPPITDHRELNPDEARQARWAVIDYLRKHKIDLGITTAVVLTVYDQEEEDKKRLRLVGTTNPKLKRFSVPLRFEEDGSVAIEEDEFELRPAYDPRRARGRARKK